MGSNSFDGWVFTIHFSKLFLTCLGYQEGNQFFRQFGLFGVFANGDASLSGRRSCQRTVNAQPRIDDVVQQIERDVLYYDESGGGVTFSGGEPLAQPDFLLALLSE